ncbi:MAG: hypothetical protein SFU56_19020 [Capsulimonadales bacterium]|nr:hypothetical protein [Capsulimonadales bacterium]
MPRCQRTFRWLTDSPIRTAAGAASWRCPHCAGRETYETVIEPDLLDYAALAQAAAFRDFGVPEDSRRTTVLFWGLIPECIREPGARQYHVYLQSGSDGYQARLQIGHEMFHRTCSQGRIFHWTHEMLACLFSVRLLRQNGAEEYADQTERDYGQQAQQCSFRTLVTTDLIHGPFPPGLYGRAFRTGREWQERFGWQALCRLARTEGRNGAPDLAEWFSAVRGRTEMREHDPSFLNQN